MRRTARSLTQRTVDSMRWTQPETGGKDAMVVRWDAEVPGFGVRVYPSGRKTYVLAYRHEGRKHIMQLGGVDVLNLKNARQEARAKLGGLSHKDPMETRRRERSGYRIEDLVQRYKDRHADQKKSGGDDKRRLDKFIVPRWGKRPVLSIKRADVADLHDEIGKTAKYEANRVLALLRKMFNLARTWGFLEETAPNPAQNVPMFKEESRDRWVTPQEMPKLAKAIDAEPNVYARAALWLYLLTGMRRTEILSLKWTDVDTDRREIRLGETKQGRPHYLPVVPAAAGIIESVPKQEGNSYVICGDKLGAHLVNIDKPWRRVRAAAGIEDVRLHDLRRTVGSWLAQNGSDLHLIGRVLGHSQVSTTAIYARFAQDHVRKALEDHSKRVLEAAKGLRKVEGGKR